MAEAIEEAPAVAVAIVWLKAWLSARAVTAKVSGSVKEGPCVVVSRTGGTLSDIIVGNPTLTFEAYADTSAEAEILAGKVGAGVRAMEGEQPSGVTVTEVSPMAGIAELPDPITERPRWTQSFVLAMRGRVI